MTLAAQIVEIECTHILTAAYDDPPPATSYQALCWLSAQARDGNPFAIALRAYHDGLLQQLTAATSAETLRSLHLQIAGLRRSNRRQEAQLAELRRQLAEARAGVIELSY